MNTHRRVIIVSLVLVPSMGRIFCWLEGAIRGCDGDIRPDLVWFLVLANFKNTTVCRSFKIHCELFPALSHLVSASSGFVVRAIASTISKL